MTPPLPPTSAHRRPSLGIVTTNHGAPWGGSEELWAALAHEALGRGYEVRVSMKRWPALPEKVQRLRSQGARLHLRRASRAGEAVYRLLPGAARRLRPALDQFRHLRRDQPDALCISMGWNFELLSMPGLPEYLEAAEVPYTLVVHFVDFPLFALRPEQRALLVRLFRQARCVALVAEQNRRDLERQLGVRLPGAVVVRNPTNLDVAGEVAWPDQPVPTLATVGRLWTKHKGQDVLLETLAQTKWRERAWVLNLYGSGPEQEYLQSLAAQFDLTDRVRFQGHVQNIRQVWAENHLLVLPSRNEGTPLALVEAMLCGRPAVVTDVGGHAEWIDDGRNGFLAPAPNARWLDEALERCWQQQSHWRELGRQARATALRLYDPAPGATLLDHVFGHRLEAVRRAA